MEKLIYILVANFFISLIAFIGIFTFILTKKFKQNLIYFISFASGVLLANAFFELIPEAASMQEGTLIYFYVILGFILFFLIERILFWRHCHEGKCKVHPFGYLNLFGDAIHNFVDGLIIAASFIADVYLGLLTTIAIIFHEIPQEIGDFAVLLYSGFSKKKALITNFLIASTSLLGGILGFFILKTKVALIFLLPFAAGGFIYIAASDLLPEIRKEISLRKSIINFVVFILGIILMFLLGFVG